MFGHPEGSVVSTSQQSQTDRLFCDAKRNFSGFAKNFCQCMMFIRAAAMTLRTVLLSIQALLGAAEPDDPQDAVVAKQYKEYPDIFRKTARHWTSIHACGKLRRAVPSYQNSQAG